jgi:hypothetical protein
MKRLLSGVTAVILALSIMGTTYHAKAMTLEEAVQQVEITNDQINKDIQEAVDEANVLVSQYQDALINASKNQDPQKVEDNIKDVVNALDILSKSYSGTTMSKEISNNIMGLDRNLTLFKWNVTKARINKNDFNYYNRVDYNNLYDEFNIKLDKIICDLIVETNQRAENLRIELAKSGFIVESEWISVNIAGRTVLIDPCRVIGF